MSLSSSEKCVENSNNRDTENFSSNISRDGEDRNSLDHKDRTKKCSGDISSNDISTDEDTNTDDGPAEEDNLGAFASHAPGTLARILLTYLEEVLESS